MKIVFSGGGTLGPVTPLLAVWDVFRARDMHTQATWVGTRHGPERALVESSGIPFIPIYSAKFSRHAPWTWPWNAVLFLVSLVQAYNVLRSGEFEACVSAGAYVSVPLVWMAWFLRIPVYIHQLDVVPGFANRLMAPFASRITVTWEQSLRAFSKKKSQIVGSMVRKVVLLGNAQMGKRRFGCADNMPCVLVTGGGTGAASLNAAVTAIIPELAARAVVVHLTGKGKMTDEAEKLAQQYSNYHPLAFLGEGMADALAAADVVITRAGMGVLSELVALRKPAILVPLPDSHQLANAQAAAQGGGAIVLSPVTPQTLLQAVTRLLDSLEIRNSMSEDISKLFPLTGAETIVQTILSHP